VIRVALAFCRLSRRRPPSLRGRDVPATAAETAALPKL